jgi:hypothetical protein
MFRKKEKPCITPTKNKLNKVRILTTPQEVQGK